MKQLFHYGQLIQSHRFRHYDYGLNRNLRIYKHAVPPDYNLNSCTAKVAIFYSDQDTTVAAEDIRRLPSELPNVVEIHRVNDDTFNHIDFVWASDAKELVYDYITDWMKSMENRNDIDNEWTEMTVPICHSLWHCISPYIIHLEWRLNFAFFIFRLL